MLFTYSEGHFIEINLSLKKWFHSWALYLLLKRDIQDFTKELPIISLSLLPLPGNEDHQMGKEVDGETSDQVPLFLIQFQISRI